MRGLFRNIGEIPGPHFVLSRVQVDDGVAFKNIDETLPVPCRYHAAAFKFRRVLREPCSQSGPAVNDGSGARHPGKLRTIESVGCLQQMIVLKHAPGVTQMFHFFPNISVARLDTSCPPTRIAFSTSSARTDSSG